MDGRKFKAVYLLYQQILHLLSSPSTGCKNIQKDEFLNQTKIHLLNYFLIIQSKIDYQIT